MAQYATSTDFATYSGQSAPAQADRMLQRASDLIDAACVSAFYLVDVNNLPTDASVILAFKNAACAQVEWWLATDDELGGQWQRTQLGGAAIALYSGAQPSGRERLCPRAREALRTAKNFWQLKPLAW